MTRLWEHGDSGTYSGHAVVKGCVYDLGDYTVYTLYRLPCVSMCMYKDGAITLEVV